MSCAYYEKTYSWKVQPHLDRKAYLDVTVPLRCIQRNWFGRRQCRPCNIDRLGAKVCSEAERSFENKPTVNHGRVRQGDGLWLHVKNERLVPYLYMRCL